MAILGTLCKDYFKLDYEKCRVQENLVLVAFTTYKTRGDRELEKTRIVLWDTFFSSIELEVQKIIAQYKGNNSEIEARALPLLQTANTIRNALYVEGGNQQSLVQYLVPKTELLKYGFDEAWVTEPIRILGSAELNCGEYNGEELNHTFYYNKLRERLVGNIEDIY